MIGNESKDVVELLPDDTEFTIEFKVTMKDFVKLRMGEPITVWVKGVKLKLVPPNHVIKADGKKKRPQLTHEERVLIAKNVIDSKGVTPRSSITTRFEQEGYTYTGSNNYAKDVMLSLEEEGYIVEGTRNNMTIRPPERD